MVRTVAAEVHRHVAQKSNHVLRQSGDSGLADPPGDKAPIAAGLSLLLTTRHSPLLAKVSGIYLPDSTLVVWVGRMCDNCVHPIVVHSG